MRTSMRLRARTVPSRFADVKHRSSTDNLWHRFPTSVVLPLLAGLLCASGCGMAVTPTPTPTTDEFEPNDTFADASPLTLDATRKLKLSGAVSRRGDVDVFTLARLEAGDRVIATATTPTSNLDIAVSIYDSGERIVYTLDDDDTEAGRLDASADFIIRRGDDPYYLVVTHSGLADRDMTVGTYELDLTIESGHPVPPPVGQTLLLNFAGGEVNSPTLGRRLISAFNATAISPTYRGQSGTIKQVIVETVEQNFERFDITVITSDMGPPPSGSASSTIWIGGFNNTVFGIAESVDQYNLDLCDDAIIYSESFSPRSFSVTPTPESLGVAIGNIVAHESGHLLGLNHVDDDLDIMDEESPADAFLQDQEFQSSPLSDTIMPLGFQDGALLLTDTVGSRPE